MIPKHTHLEKLEDKVLAVTFETGEIAAFEKSCRREKKQIFYKTFHPYGAYYDLYMRGKGPCKNISLPEVDPFSVKGIRCRGLLTEGDPFPTIHIGEFSPEATPFLDNYLKQYLKPCRPTSDILDETFLEIVQPLKFESYDAINWPRFREGLFYLAVSMLTHPFATLAFMEYQKERRGGDDDRKVSFFDAAKEEFGKVVNPDVLLKEQRENTLAVYFMEGWEGRGKLEFSLQKFQELYVVFDECCMVTPINKYFTHKSLVYHKFGEEMPNAQLKQLTENAKYYLPADPQLLGKFNQTFKEYLDELAKPYLQNAQHEELLQFLKEVGFFSG